MYEDGNDAGEVSTVMDQQAERPMRPISKTGNIRKHFDDSHGRAAPVLLKATEAHLYEEANDGYEASTVAGPYQD